MEQKKNTSPIQINDFKVIWRIISKNWYIPLLIVPIFYALGYFYVYRLPNVYQASIELLKSNDSYYQNSLITEGAGGFYGGGSKSFIDNSNEIRILTSFDLMKETVIKLKDKLQVSYYLIGRVRKSELFTSMPFSVYVNSINPTLIEKPIKFKVLNKDSYELTYFNGETPIIKQGRFNQIFTDLDFNIYVSTTKGVNADLASSLALLDYELLIHDIDLVSANLQRALKVKNPDYTNVLVLTLDDIIPERAILILDTLSKGYIGKSLNSRFEINERTISFIEKQLEDVRFSLKEIEDTMQNFKKQNSILDLEWERADFFQKLSKYDGQKSGLGLKIDALTDLEKYIIEDKDPQFLPPNVFLVDNDNFLQSSVTELYNSQIQLSNLLGSSKDDNPHVIEIRQKIKKLKQNMLVYINNSRNATFKIIENINGEIGTYTGEISTIPKKQREMVNIQRKVSVNEGLYNFLLQKRANVKIAKASIVSEIKVIDSSRNKGVISPDKNKIISTFLTVGMALALLIIIIKVMYFTTIQTSEELKEKTKLPIIADLPFQKDVGDTGFIIDESPKSFIAEAFRTLRTNLQYVILNSNKKTILVTSNGPGEGKTFTTINLGAILAKGGKRVVMLELDLHKPRIQKALQMNADIGISTFMTGFNTLNEIVKPTVIPNLFTILSGPIPPNPSDLVLSEKLKELIDYAKQEFDYVLIDTPPIGLLSDAAFLMQYSDINLVVINTKFATKSILDGFNKLVTENAIKDVYLILNGVKRLRSKYYYSRYGYSYGYGYGYGYGYNKKG